METMIDHVAKSLGKDVEAVKRANLYKQGQASLLKSKCIGTDYINGPHLHNYIALQLVLLQCFQL